MRSQLVLPGKTLFFLSGLVGAKSSVDSDLNFGGFLADDSVFLLPETSFSQPIVPALDQISSTFNDGAVLAEAPPFTYPEDDEFLVEIDPTHLADACSESEQLSRDNGIAKARIKRLDFASGSCVNPASDGGADDLDLTNVDPGAIDLLELFRTERTQDFLQAKQNKEHNPFCYLLTAGILPWGVCYGGYRGLDDISVNDTPLQTSWAFWHTVTVSQITYGKKETEEKILDDIIIENSSFGMTYLITD